MSELNNIEELVSKDEKLIDIWGRRNPRFEKKYEQSVLRVISDYGIGASENTGAKGKVLGAGYEPYIMAFFIGLYSNKKLQLSESSEDLKVLGQPIDKWGNLDSKNSDMPIPVFALTFSSLWWQRQKLTGLPLTKVT